MVRALRVLFVDDDENDSIFFSLAVEKAPVPVWVETVPNGKAAIDFLEGRADGDSAGFRIPDLIVLDLKMPVVNGFDFLVWHCRSSFSHIPVFVFEGSGDKEELQKAISMGAKKAFTKPAGFEGMEHIVKEISACLH